MAERTRIVRLGEPPRQTVLSRLITAGFVALSLSGLSQNSLAELPAPSPMQWKQSIERLEQGRWDYDGTRILGSIEYDFCVWDAATGRLLHRLKKHCELIHKVQACPDGNHALSSSWIPPEAGNTNLKSKDTRTVLWNLTTGKVIHSLPGQVAGEFSPDGNQIVTFSLRADEIFFDAKVWDVLTGRELAKITLDGQADPASDTLHFSPNGSRIAFVSNGMGLQYNSSRVILYNSTDGREVGRVSAQNGIHRYTSNGALACFGSELVSIVDIESGQSLKNFKHSVKGIVHGTWTHDGRKIMLYEPHGSNRILDVDSKRILETSDQRGAIVSPDNKVFLIAWCKHERVDRTTTEYYGFTLYEVDTGKEISAIAIPSDAYLIGFAPDSKTLLLGGPNAAIYNATDGTKLRGLALESLKIE